MRAGAPIPKLKFRSLNDDCRSGASTRPYGIFRAEANAQGRKLLIVPVAIDPKRLQGGLNCRNAALSCDGKLC
jgi:hypothetical protein